MSWPKLRDLALYFLQALLWIGAIYMGVAIFGGMAYLHLTKRLRLVAPEVVASLKTDSSQAA